MKYKVKLVEELLGETFVEAEDIKEAEGKALETPDVDWNDEYGGEVRVATVEEVSDEEWVELFGEPD